MSDYLCAHWSKERRPTASISALPNPFVSFELVGILQPFGQIWKCGPVASPPAILRSKATKIRFGSGLRKMQREQLKIFPCP
jgi:hypothetical protein